MKWSRRELKKNGKAAMKRTYWPCVVVSLILSVLTYVETKAARGNRGINLMEVLQSLQQESGLTPEVFTGLVGGVTMMTILIAILIDMFVKNMLLVGGARFFVNNSRYTKGNLSDVIAPYSEGNFVSIFVTMLLRDLFIALWGLLLFVPGIIKTYSYRMVPYILADHPDVDPLEAIRMSKEMMKGQKWKAFILDLSFLGWKILSACTFGILGLLYVGPYIEATNAELYNALCD